MSTIDVTPSPLPPPHLHHETTELGHIDKKLAAVLGYLPIAPIDIVVPIVWLASEPRDSEFLRFHSAQSLAWVIANAVFAFAYAIVTGVLGAGLAAMPRSAGVLAALVFGLLGLLALAWGVFSIVVLVIAMIRSAQGDIWRMPVIGDVAWRAIHRT